MIIIIMIIIVIIVTTVVVVVVVVIITTIIIIIIVVIIIVIIVTIIIIMCNILPREAGEQASPHASAASDATLCAAGADFQIVRIRNATHEEFTRLAGTGLARNVSNYL